MAKMTEEEKTSRYGCVVAQMNSTRDTRTVYEVRYKNGAWSCSCKGFIFHKTCRHTQHAEQHSLVGQASRAEVHLQYEGFVIDDLLLAGGIRNIKGIARERMSEKLAEYIKEWKLATPEENVGAKLLVGGVRMITLED